MFRNFWVSVTLLLTGDGGGAGRQAPCVSAILRGPPYLGRINMRTPAGDRRRSLLNYLPTFPFSGGLLSLVEARLVVYFNLSVSSIHIVTRGGYPAIRPWIDGTVPRPTIVSDVGPQHAVFRPRQSWASPSAVHGDVHARHRRSRRPTQPESSCQPSPLRPLTLVQHPPPPGEPQLPPQQREPGLTPLLKHNPF